ncbi:TetR/AcrR family transcriptional regulator [Sphingobium scionense]
MREIAAAAGQKNHGAVSYYFGSKEALVRALVMDGAMALDRERNAALDGLEAQGGPRTIREVVEILVRGAGAARQPLCPVHRHLCHDPSRHDAGCDRSGLEQRLWPVPGPFAGHDGGLAGGVAEPALRIHGRLPQRRAVGAAAGFSGRESRASDVGQRGECRAFPADAGGVAGGAGGSAGGDAQGAGATRRRYCGSTRPCRLNRGAITIRT